MGQRGSPKLVSAKKCVHASNVEGNVTAFGVTRSFKLRVKRGHVDYCLECLARMAIQCGRCESPIFIGDPVILYSPTCPDLEIPEYAHVFSQDPLQLVACLGMDCAPDDADRVGFWKAGEARHGYVELLTLYTLDQGGERGAIGSGDDQTELSGRVPHPA